MEINNEITKSKEGLKKLLKENKIKKNLKLKEEADKRREIIELEKKKNELIKNHEVLIYFLFYFPIYIIHEIQI